MKRELRNTVLAVLAYRQGLITSFVRARGTTEVI